MQVELINTGSELMLGRVLNTHQQWLCRQLCDAGYLVSRQVCIADKADQIQDVVREALGRADLIITTGGLGPTSDDITRDYIAQLVGKELREDAGIVEHIRRFFEGRGRAMPESTRVQAMVPEGALALPNPNGTAPGLAIELNPNPFRNSGKPSWIIMLPGPPRELRPMYLQSVVPLLTRVLPAPEQFVCRTLRTCGIPESLVEEKIGKPLLPLVNSGLELGYCARTGQVDVRLASRGALAVKLVAEAYEIVNGRIGSFVYAEGDAEIEHAVMGLLVEKKLTVAVAESCTGGLIAHRLTNVPGASVSFAAGYITYSNEAKESMLGVRRGTLDQFGAVSEPVAREMAEGARREARVDYAIAVTGIAGPTGGTAEKPVGTVFIALAGPRGTVVSRQLNPYDRETFKMATAQQSMELLRKHIAKSASPGSDATDSH